MKHLLLPKELADSMVRGFGLMKVEPNIGFFIQQVVNSLKELKEIDVPEEEKDEKKAKK
jgi:hypothetical protein